MNFTLANGETIQVDPGVLQQIQGQNWNVDKSGTVYRSYWDSELKKSRRLNLRVVVAGEPPRGTLWRHKDGDWRNFRCENLELVIRGKHHDRAFGGMDKAALQEVGRRGGAARAAMDLPSRPGRRAPRKPGKGYTGVQPSGKRYRAIIMRHGKQRHLGMFDTKVEAAKAYDQALAAAGLPPVNFPTDYDREKTMMERRRKKRTR